MLNAANPIRNHPSGSPPPIVLRPAADTSFTLVGDRPLVFSEANQQIYELNRVGAYIWCKLLERKTSEAISNELGEYGINRSEARRFVRQAMHQWLDLGLVDIDWEPLTERALHAQLAQFTIVIQSSNQQLLNRLEPLFRHSSVGAGQREVLIEIVELADQILFRANNGRVSRCQVEGLAPAIKASLTEHVILGDQSDLALHAASLVKDGNGLLLCGSPGMGKSTLALHLTHAGFQYGGDDVVLITPDGGAEGIPFAPTVKQSAWEMISRLRSDLEQARVHRRCDGVLVRYLPVADLHRGPFSTRWIIFLNRISGISTELRRVEQIDAIGRVIDGAFAVHGKLSRRAFVALKRILAGAESLELTYSAAVEAQRVLANHCHGQS